MRRKLKLITGLFIFSFFMLACYDNSGGGSGKSSVTLRFNELSQIQSIDGLPVSKSPSKSPGIPVTVTDIRIKVYSGNEADGELFDDTIPAIGSVTIEIPAGLARVFKVYGIEGTTGYVTYSGFSAPVDLVGGEDITVFIPLSTATADAIFSVKLLGEDGVSDFADPGYLATSGNKFTAEVFRPTVTSTDVILDSAKNTQNSTSFKTTIEGLTAYAATPQVVIVRAFTLDGTIAAIGMAAFGDLSSGINSKPVPVAMIRPGRIRIDYTSAITSLKVEMEIGGTGLYKEIDTSMFAKGTSSILVSVPNFKTNIGSSSDFGSPRNVRITVNGTTPTINPGPIKWKLWQVKFSVADGWTWKEITNPSDLM